MQLRTRLLPLYVEHSYRGKVCTTMTMEMTMTRLLLCAPDNHMAVKVTKQLELHVTCVKNDDPSLRVQMITKNRPPINQQEAGTKKWIVVVGNQFDNTEKQRNKYLSEHNQGEVVPTTKVP